MMDTLRNSTKPIFLITIFAFVVGFIFLDLGRGSVSCAQRKRSVPNAIAVVNGEPISLDEYERQANAAAQQAAGGQDVPDRVRLELSNQTYHQLVEDMLLRQCAVKRGLGVSRKEILAGLYENPPREIMQSPLFATNGQFDMSRYYQALDNVQVRERLVAARTSQLPIDKLQYELTASARASSGEVMEILASRRQNATVSFVRVSPSLFGPQATTLGEDEVRQYYDSHLADYTPKEAAVITYAYLERRATPDDTLATRDVMDSIYYELEGGEQFDVLMGIHSEAQGNMRGGPQGAFINKGSPEMSFELAAVLDTLGVGKSSNPFGDAFGFHIVTVDSTKVENGVTSYRIKDILMRVNASAATGGELAERMQAFRERVKGGGSFQSNADTTGIVITTTDQIDLTQPNLFLPGIPMFQELTDFVKTAKVGAVGEVFEGPSGYYVWKLDSRGPGKPSDLAKIEPQVRAAAARSRGHDVAQQKAQAIADMVRAGSSLEAAVASETPLRLETGKKFVRYGSIPGVGKDPVIMGTAFAMPVGTVAGPLETEVGDFFVVRLDERDPEITAPAESDKGLSQNVQDMKRSEILSSELEALRQRANIHDLRPVRVGTL